MGAPPSNQYPYEDNERVKSASQSNTDSALGGGVQMVVVALRHTNWDSSAPLATATAVRSFSPTSVSLIRRRISAENVEISETGEHIR